MEGSFYIGILNNISLLLALGYVYSVCARRWDTETLKGKIIVGVLFGGVAIAGMEFPVQYASGITFDGRTILLGIVGLFGGGMPAIVAVLMTGGLRIWQGGAGQWAGLATIVSAASLGVLFHTLRIRYSWRSGLPLLYAFGCVVHIAMLLCMLILPDPIRWQVLSDISLPVLLVYPVATMFYGHLFNELETRKNTMVALSLSEAKLRTLVANIPDLVWLKNYDGVYLLCNPPFERLFGALTKDIIGKTDYDFVDGKLASSFRENDRIAMAAGKPTVNEEWLTYASDGQRVLVETVKTPMYGADGTLIGVLGIARDITERKQAAAAILASEERLYRAMKFVPSPLVIFTDNGEILQISDSWTKVTGYTHDDIPTVGDWVRNAYPDIHAARNETILSVFDSSEPRFHPGISVMTKSEETRIWDITAVSLGELSDGRRAALTMATDITESRKMETERLETLKKTALMERMVSLGTLAAGVAHEINQPLQALKVTADTMSYGYSQGKPMDVEITIENTKRISSQADRIAKIVKRMRDFVVQSQNSVMAAINLHDVIRDGLAMMKQRLQSHNIKLEENLYATMHILGDKSRLEEVVINIVVNAMQAMEEVQQYQKQIVVSTRDDQNQVILEISNNGPQIPPDVIERIFDPFFTSKISGENMGLGMSIVFSIVSSHDGTIRVRNLEAGVTFIIAFPSVGY